MEEMHKVDRSGVLKLSEGKRKGSGFSGVQKKRVGRQEDQGEYAQEGEQRVSFNKVERVRKKVKGLLGKDGLLYHGEAEPIAAVAAPTKVPTSRCVWKIEAHPQHWLQLRRKMPVSHPITEEGFCEALVRRACAIFGANNDWPHLFIACAHCRAATSFHKHPQQVIRRQLSHAWKTFYCQSYDQLFSWLGGQLDCRCSPAFTWKPEANQCGLSSASSTLAQSRPMIAEADYVWLRICYCGSFSAHAHAPRASCGAWLAAENSLGRVASFAGVLYTFSFLDYPMAQSTQHICMSPQSPACYWPSPQNPFHNVDTIPWGTTNLHALWSWWGMDCKLPIQSYSNIIF
ncbi:hypothetical protein O181_036147 [Austropuccinia psidii MF-1]|uniref:Uncharacterized protein n=1 Tax=Austropuccinia psidii MF-1 TaxID=1389203 RepID=A0A9Q3D6J8_9BASI|nr:hypothetical protein [Austropuccinia psidii MF-1]